MSEHVTIDRLLTGDLTGVSRLLVQHVRKRQFRWLVLQRGIVAELSFDPPSAEAGERVIAQLLERAAREGIVVVETVRHAEDQTAEIAEVWYGGRVLLATCDPKRSPCANVGERPSAGPRRSTRGRSWA